MLSYFRTNHNFNYTTFPPLPRFYLSHSSIILRLLSLSLSLFLSVTFLTNSFAFCRSLSLLTCVYLGIASNLLTFSFLASAALIFRVWLAGKTALPTSRFAFLPLCPTRPFIECQFTVSNGQKLLTILLLTNDLAFFLSNRSRETKNIVYKLLFFFFWQAW